MERIGVVLITLMVLIAARETRAVDGVIEINHARALAGGVTTGDTAGYPVTLSQTGSYRLTGSLTPQNTSAIAITASNVTLDLNGFTLSPTSPVPGVHGIDATGGTDVHIRDGTVSSFGGSGLVAGDRARIEDVTVRSNGGAGISVGVVSRVERCTAHANADDGIHAAAASRVADSLAWANADSGIYVEASSTITGNTTNGNAGYGLWIGAGGTVSENTSAYNTLDGIYCAGGGCSVLHNTVTNNHGDGIEVAGHSAVIGNAVQNNDRCGVNVGNSCPQCFSGLGQNVVNANNGSPTNRQISATSWYEMSSLSFSGQWALRTNVCSSSGSSTLLCDTNAPAANCP